MTTENGISQNSRRIASNTALLYVRMLVLMLIGLFTSRVVLRMLGVSDYGIYNVVYGMVMMFSIASNSVSNAISRFLAFELGRTNNERVRKVFSTSIFIQAGMSLLLLLVAETVGVWYLHNHIVLPQGREDAAMWVLQCSVLLMIVQLFSLPFNATIIAHEQMKAFAWISILEAILKLAVAFCLYFTPFGKLESYAVLMVVVAIIVRGTYAIYCHSHFDETKGPLVWDKALLKEMTSFSGWSFLGNGVSVLNTQGVNLLSNSFFGVRINAARGIAGQVENITKQFVTNFLTALNPQITKSWASGNKDYCYELVTKGCKFTFLMMLFFIIPICFEGEIILQLWLGEVPPYAVNFTTLALVCVLVDMAANSLFQLVLASGKLACYYIITSIVNLMTFILAFISFAHGGRPEDAYWIFIGIGLVTNLLKLAFAHRITGIPIKGFLQEAVEKPIWVAFISSALCLTIVLFLPSNGWRLLLTLCVSTLATGFFSYALALTDGERQFIKDSVWRR